jgi:hypothetical protein
MPMASNNEFSEGRKVIKLGKIAKKILLELLLQNGIISMESPQWQFKQTYAKYCC